jgi:hypothetical protein
VQQDPRRAERGQLASLLEQRLGLAGPAGAVDEPGLELGARIRDGRRGRTQVGDVVERIVQPEDVDPVRGGRRDEAANEVVVGGTRADEKPPADGEPEGRLRPGPQRPDPLPRALDSPANGAVEAAPAGDLEVGEAGAVEDLGDEQLVGRRQAAGEGILAEQPDRRVRKARYGGSLSRAKRGPGQALEMYRFSRGSTLMRSPLFTNIGT